MSTSGKNKPSLCIICEHDKAQDMYWVYVWKNKQGFACEPCGRRFHDIGEYLMSSAAKFCEDNGIKHLGWKEKFGSWRFSPSLTTKEEEMKVKMLHSIYSKLYPEFEWDWDL